MKSHVLDESSNIKISTTKTYMLALSLVAILSIGAYAVMHKVISSQGDRAAVINVSGRQRMLSQRLSLYSEYLNQASDNERQEVRHTLVGLLEKFEHAHARVAYGDEDLGQPIPKAKEIYFGTDQHLDADVRTFIAEIHALVDTDSFAHEKIEDHLTRIRTFQDELLPKLDLVVQANQDESDVQVSNLRKLETGILFFTLLLLLVEAFFIFRPMVKSLSRLFGAAVDARETAIRATNDKSAFLATVTHEIRTPMTGVLGITEELLDSSLDDNSRDQVLTLRQLSETLISMVNNILDYSKIEAGKMVLEDVQFGVALLANDSQKLFAAAASQKGIDLKTKIELGLPPFLDGDPTRLRQVVTNFVGNALKFTPKGGTVTVTYKALHLDEKEVALRIEVKDTGPGIFKANQAKLFQSYAQEDETVARKHGGTGLGLSICRQIAEAMGGAVGVDSEEGKGATFWFEVRLKRGTSVQSLIQTAAPPGQWAVGLKLLLVEDNEVNQKIVKAQLTKMGFEVLTAVSGKEALKSNSAQAFDVILMDCEMDDMDGFEASTTIRDIELKTGAQPVPILALTAHKIEDVQDRCFEAGMNSIVSKPIRQEALSAILYDRLSYKSSKAA